MGEGITLSEDVSRVLAAAADTLIPAGAGMPAPSTVGIIDFFTRFVAPRDAGFVYYPFAAEVDLEQIVGTLGNDYAAVPAEEQRARMEALEQSSEEPIGLFWKLRELVYFGYYSRPSVVIALQQALPAAKDYRGAPQPRGYEDVIEDWPEGRYSGNGGTYTETDDVKPLERDALARLVADQLASGRGRPLAEETARV